MIPFCTPDANIIAPDRALAGLTARHLADLHASGLSDQQIAACGFHSLQAPASVQKALSWKRYNGELGECLCIPFFDAAGKPSGYVRLKPDHPRKGKEDGKAIRYESPKGASNRAYFPPGTLAALSDPSAALVITEGEKKSAAADQHGFACIGLVGVYGWQKKRAKDAAGKPIGERELIDDLAAIPWQGRPVYLSFDSDSATNPNVRKAECHLAGALTRKGAIVKVVRLPQGETGPDGKPAKVGIDDYLLAHGPDSFRALMTAAVEPAPPEKGLTPNESPDDPHRLARLYIAERCQHPDGLTLRAWRDEWHRWDGSAYRILPVAELRAELAASAKAELDRQNVIAQKMHDTDKPPPSVKKVTGRLTADVAHALASMTMLPTATKAPSWIGARGPFDAGEVLACRNGLVHLPALVTGKNYFARPTPRYFSPNCLDLDFDMKAPTPWAWLAFLAMLWPNDPQSIATLQEWIGYLLTPDTRQQKIMMLIGPKRGGKGTIARIIRGLIGEGNIAGPTLSSLSTNFGLWPLVGKTVAMIQDARLSGRTDAAIIVERLLSLSGEDGVDIDRKNMAHIPAAKLFARFMLFSNELPKLNDSSGALPGRMILLRLTQSWYGKEDTGLTDRLLTELPGILLWAIEGWRRLRERGHFIQPDASREMIDELADLSSPVGAFVRDECRTAPGSHVERSILFDAWRRWCGEQGREHPGDARTFGRNLRAVVPTLGDAQPTDKNGKRIRVYENICLK